jgi:hypothetical protein
VDYLDRLCGLGVAERYIELERDACIMIAAQVPHLIDSVIAKQHEDRGSSTGQSSAPLRRL